MILLLRGHSPRNVVTLGWQCTISILEHTELLAYINCKLIFLSLITMLWGHILLYILIQLNSVHLQGQFMMPVFVLTTGMLFLTLYLVLCGKLAYSLTSCSH